MTNTCTLIFHPADLLAALADATNGVVPPNARLLEVLQHPQLERIIALLAESPSWRSPQPIQLRYTDNEILVYDGSDEPAWTPIETP